MKFAIIHEPTPVPPDIAPVPINPKLEVEPEPVKKPEPQKKIPIKRLKSMIDDMGHRVNNDRNATTEQKLEGWIDILKWALPLIPDDEQHFKSIVQNSIENPSQWDFMEKPRR